MQTKTMDNTEIDLKSKKVLYSCIACIAIAIIPFSYAIISIFDGAAEIQGRYYSGNYEPVQSQERPMEYWFMIIANVFAGIVISWLGLRGLINRRNAIIASNKSLNQTGANNATPG